MKPKKMADDCTISSRGNEKQANIAVSNVVKTPICHVVDRGFDSPKMRSFGTKHTPSSSHGVILCSKQLKLAIRTRPKKEPKN